MRDRKRLDEFQLAHQCSAKQKYIITMDDNHIATQQNEVEIKGVGGMEWREGV